MTIDMNMSVRHVTGVGAARGAQLERLGITTVGELLYHFPRAYEYRGNVKTVISAQDGETASFVLTVASPATSARTKNGRILIKLSAFDDTGNCGITFFNQSYIKTALTVGAVYRFYGKVSRFGRSVQLTSPVYEPYSLNLLPLFPVYPTTEGLSSLQIYRMTSLLLKSNTASLPENLPDSVIKNNALMDRFSAVAAVHQPQSFAQLAEAKRRLIFEEIFSFARDIYQRREGDLVLPYVKMSAKDCTAFKSMLKFTPTGAQRRTMNEIYSDLTGKNRKAPMRRIVSGDVGSGKTVCAQFAAYLAAENGYQTAFMVPTEILANQHFADTEPFFTALGIKTRLLTGETAKAEKEKIYAEITSGECDVVIGTHALLVDKVVFSSLGLVICDEQHRFGVSQRDALTGKGEGAHLLVMSATPIPRTLALVLFGDLDVSVLDEMPPGRQAVATYAAGEEDREKVYGFIRRQVQQGRQAFIVCPAVHESEDDSGDGLIPQDALSNGFSPDAYNTSMKKRKAAVDYANSLQKDVFPDMKVGYIHGKLKGSEKNAIMREFEQGNINILVSTTVIEVGINIPNASVMLVEDADCFGLSQLHQLRGRVGRGKYASTCILMSSDPGQVARDRLSVMANENNGYKIAEYDLKMRGPGDFIRENEEKIRQHGTLKLKLAGMLDDTELLYKAFEAAKTATVTTGTEAPV